MKSEQKLTTGDVARLTGLSTARIWQLAECGVLPAERFGRNQWLRFERRDIEAFLQSQNGTVPPEPIQERTPPEPIQEHTPREEELAGRTTQRPAARMEPEHSLSTVSAKGAESFRPLSVARIESAYSLSTKQVAEMTGLCPVRIWQLAARGVLPCVRQGLKRRLRFDPRDIELFLQDLQNISVPERVHERTPREAALAGRRASRELRKTLGKKGTT